ncbi:hypothetical protein V5P93_004672 [Actinokineospora auranticolor]|uniref:NB-ARC domain-containing protein n=1 Tax=Actinokineospora auranticolor TaxID=155976 RepID=A0A2S6GNC2_9PSEU|nr:hypothetical protein [Actinokineospora auranticolor]PPK66631.1 hypothetical protein CLV40_10916 [Actinokineospora auranticolor]
MRAGHELVRDGLVARVLFVNLRGFDPDPAAVLDGFLRLLGMPGRRIPHDLSPRIAAYRARLAGIGTLIVLDDAATAEQVRPLLPGVAGCPVLITTGRSLTTLAGATHLTVTAFPPGDAMDVRYPDETHRRPRIPPPPTPIPALADETGARAWLDTERPTLVAVTAHTATRGQPAHTIRFAATPHRYLIGGHPTDPLAVHAHAARAARHTGLGAPEADTIRDHLTTLDHPSTR